MVAWLIRIKHGVDWVFDPSDSFNIAGENGSTDAVIEDFRKGSIIGWLDDTMNEQALFVKD